MRHVSSFGLALLAAVFVAPSAAFAGTSTANMNVSITISSGCTISVSDINFGSVAATVLSTALTSTASQGGLLSYQCGVTGTTPALTAGNGLYNAGGNRMKGSLGAFIPYSLNLPTVAAFTGNAQTAQITATIPAQAVLPAADTYTDAVVLTLTY
jgi:spore coat protein U-like protein